MATFCQWGTLDTHVIKVELDSGIFFVTKIVNRVLTRFPLPIPANIIPFMTLTDLNIGYYDDYIYFGVTPIFGAQPPSQDIFIQ